MDRLLDSVLDAFTTVVGGAVSAVTWPAAVIGIPPEILAVGLFCVLLLVLWRSMGSYIK